MVNASLNWASIVGIALAICGGGLVFLGLFKPDLAKGSDIFFGSIGILCGGILFFQGWRLDPILQFGQFLLAGTTLFIAYDNLQLRNRLFKLKSQDNNNHSKKKDSSIEGDYGVRERFKPGQEKVNAFRRRQRDTGWGYAFASYLIPFVGLYYAISRRTITPILYSLGGELMFFFALSLVGGLASLVSEDFAVFIWGIGFLASFAVGIYLVKLGIDKARNFAKFELRELGQEGDIRTNKEQLSSDYKDKEKRYYRNIGLYKKDDLEVMEDNQVYEIVKLQLLGISSGDINPESGEVEYLKNILNNLQRIK